MSPLNRVLIAGGGIVGLTAAIALRRTGTDVVVFEQAAEIRAIGASIGLWENALRAFDFLGVGDDVRRIGRRAEMVFLHLSNGTTETGDLLIGADGVFSAVRGQLAPEARVREHIGHLSWRAILPQTPTRIERDVLVIGHDRCRGGYLRRPGEGAFWLVAQFESPPVTDGPRGVWSSLATRPTACRHM